MTLATGDQFPQSTAGWLIGVGTPVIAALIAAMWASWARRIKAQDLMIAKLQESATEQNKALAILLSDHNHVAATVATNTARLAELDKSLAVLASQVQDHHRWAERQRSAGNPHAT